MNKTIKNSLLLLFVAIIMCIIPSVVNATENSEIQAKNSLSNGLVNLDVFNGYNNLNYVTLNLDGAKLYDIFTNAGNLQNNNGYVYDTILINVPSNSTKIELLENGKTTQLEIKENGTSKYVEYNVNLFKKDSSLYNKFEEVRSYGNGIGNDISLNCYNAEQLIETNKYNIMCIVNGIAGNMKIVNADGTTVDGLTGSGEGAWEEFNVPTYNDYTNCYYQIHSEQSLGNNFTIDNIGTFNYDKQEKVDNTLTYVYKCKVSDPSKFYKPMKDTTYYYTLKVANTNKTYIQRTDITIYGAERKVYKVENDNLSIEMSAPSDNSLELKAEEISKGSDTYLEMTKTLPENTEYLYTYELSLVGGEYKGELPITFTVGEQYNGKKILITHLKSDKTIETFTETVVNGKVTVVVNELSPFMLALADTKETTTTTPTTDVPATEKDNGKDVTPKTGSVQYIFVALIAIAICGAGIIVFKKK